MKKTVTKIIASILAIMLVITLFQNEAAKAVTYEGTGTSSNPYVSNMQTAGSDTMEYTVPTAGDGYAYFTLKFTRAYKLTLKNEGSYTMVLDGKSASYFTSVIFKAGTEATLKVRGNKGQTGKLYITLVETGESLEELNSKDKAKDITNGYDSMSETFEECNSYVWYKFNITKQSVIKLIFNQKSTYFDIYDSDLKTIIDHGQYSKDSVMSYYNVRRMQGTETEDYVSYKIFREGTYYLKAGITSGYDGKMNFSVRDYIPITGINFTEGKNISIATGFLEDSSVKNNIKSLNPSNTDGEIKYTLLEKSSTNNVFDQNFDGKTVVEKIIPKRYGMSKLGYYDERGVKVDEVTVKVTPAAPGHMTFRGSTNKIEIFTSEGVNTNGDYVRVYKLNGKKWKCIGQIKRTKMSKGKIMTVKKLKAGKNYKFKFTAYDSKSKMESPKSKVFIAGTAVSGKTKIKHVSAPAISSRKDAVVHNPGKITEWREPYTIYGSSVKITVKKVKGVTGYVFSNGSKIKKSSGTIKVGSAYSSKSKLPKKTKLRVRTYRKINSYAVAYGKYSKAKTVRVR